MDDWVIALLSAVIGATASGFIQHRIGAALRADREAGEMTASCRVVTREVWQAVNVASLTRTEDTWVGGRVETRAWQEHRSVLARSLVAKQWNVVFACAESIDEFEGLRSDPGRGEKPDSGAKYAAEVLETRADLALRVMDPYCRDRLVERAAVAELIRRSQGMR